MPTIAFRPAAAATRGHTALERVWHLVERTTAGEHELLAEVSRTADERHVAYVARPTTSAEVPACVVLSVDQATTEAHGTADHYAVGVRSALDATVLAVGLSCPACSRPAVTWDVTCRHCGQSIAGDDVGVPAATLYEGIREAVGDRYEVLGVVAHGTNRVLYVARELRGESMALLRVRRETGPAAGDNLALNVEAIATLATLSRGARPDAAGSSPHSGEVGPLAAKEEVLLSRNRPRVSRPSPAAGASAISRKVCPQCETVYDGDLKFCPTDGQSLRPLDSRDNLIGRLLGDRYHVTALLGQGGMGRVYVAEHVRIGRKCAVKVLAPELVERQDAVRRFAREARNASRIAHPNVAAVYDFEQTADGLMYLAMEFVDGRPLAAMLASEGKPGLSRSIAIARQIADAIQAAHDLKIVHRDLKPDNVMITTDRDGRDMVKVVDFGIAKALHDDGDRMTRTGFVVGTPRYMSPEQLSGGAVDGRSDVYSLGCVLFEMLTGQGPADGAGPDAVIGKRLGEPPPRASTVNPDLPEALDDILLRALARDPADRYQTAVEFRDALVAAPTHAPVRRSRSRGSRAVVLAAGAAIVVLVGSFVLWLHPRGAKPAAPAPPQDITAAPVVAAPPVVRVDSVRPVAPAPPPVVRDNAPQNGDPPSDALDDADRGIRMGRYYASKDPPDFAQASQSFRAANDLLVRLARHYPQSAAVIDRRRSLDSTRAQARRDCASLAALGPAQGSRPQSCE